jgi:hypothetical protein
MIGLGSILEKTVVYLFTYAKSSLVNLKFFQRWIENETLRSFLGSIGSTLMIFVIVFLPITWIIILNVSSFNIEPLIPSLAFLDYPFREGFIPAADAETIAEEISLNLTPEDFVITPGQVSWMLPCHTADIRTVGTYEFGGKTPELYDFVMNRFTVNSSLNNARYAVVDNYWRVWMVSSYPEYDSILEEVNN